MNVVNLLIIFVILTIGFIFIYIDQYKKLMRRCEPQEKVIYRYVPRTPYDELREEIKEIKLYCGEYMGRISYQTIYSDGNHPDRLIGYRTYHYNHYPSGLSKCAGLVMAPKSQAALRHIEFVHLGNQRSLVVIISQDGIVENRLIDLPDGITVSMLNQASNYINAHFEGATLQEVLQRIHSQISQNKHELDQLTQKVVEAGIGVWSGDKENGSLIIK